MSTLNGFKLWIKEPNTICDGARVYTRRLFFAKTKNIFKNRMIRVYLPSTYDFNDESKRFPVIYMTDGKNLFDDHTSFVGEWGIDETIEDMIHKGETEGIIVVGVDAPKRGKDRMLEMMSPEIEVREEVKLNGGYSNLLGEYIFKQVKPLIDSTFYTLSDKEHTAVGGSSAGGLMAFDLAVNYPEYINYALAFSPAFFLFEEESFERFLENKINKSDSVSKIYFYVGGVGFEEQFIKATEHTYQFMKNKGYKDNEIKYVIDRSQEHNEKAWRIYFPDAIKYFNYLK